MLKKRNTVQESPLPVAFCNHCNLFFNTLPLLEINELFTFCLTIFLFPFLAFYASALIHPQYFFPFEFLAITLLNFMSASVFISIFHQKDIK